MAVLPCGRIVVVSQQLGYPINPDPNNYTRDTTDPQVFHPSTGTHLVSQTVTLTPNQSEIYMSGS